ncbi:MAG TPA: hypothetical protein ENH84_07945 [Phycisphaerae bacterium]|nr:hypothetical protein [Phycisphaerae bacterium]
MKNMLVLAMSTLFFATIGCNQNKAVDTSGVDEIARDFLRGISDDQAQRVYEAYFSSELRSEKPLKQWIETAKAYQTRLGAFTSLQRTTGRAKRIDDRGEGQVEYSVQWEKAKGSLILNITEEGDWKIRSFEIRSPLFQKAVREDGLKPGTRTKSASQPQGTPKTMPVSL